MDTVSIVLVGAGLTLLVAGLLSGDAVLIVPGMAALFIGFVLQSVTPE
jgi:membrane protein implicated in regulation of membrane protease activity